MFNTMIVTTLRAVLIATLALGVAVQQIYADEPAAHQGTWTKFKAKTKGSWSISTVDGTSYIEFDEAFKTKKAPDLKVVLSPKPVDKITNKNALEGSLIIQELKEYKGAQRFRIPDGVNLDDYKSVLIHCEKYTFVWSGGSLN